jgi:tetratricopeptide (TPR) repeat protein
MKRFEGCLGFHRPGALSLSSDCPRMNRNGIRFDRETGENMKLIIQLAMLYCLLILAACAPQETSKASKMTINVVTPSTEDAKADDADVREVVDGVKMLEAGHVQAAIDGPFNDVARRYEAKYANSKSKIYSARGMTDALLYSLASTTAKPPVNSVVLGPAWAMAYWGRGYAYNEMARYDDAIIELHKALALAPYDTQYQVELAYAYQQKRDWQQSLALFQSALDYADITASQVLEMKCKALRGQGYDLVELHRLDEAEAAYRGCIKLQPNEPKSLAELQYIRQLRAKKAG